MSSPKGHVTWWPIIGLLSWRPIFNSLWPSVAIWWHRSGSALAQLMACCLMAPSHYLPQCWLIISEVLWHLPKGNFTGSAWDIYPWYEFENYQFKITGLTVNLLVLNLEIKMSSEPVVKCALLHITSGMQLEIEIKCIKSLRQKQMIKFNWRHGVNFQAKVCCKLFLKVCQLHALVSSVQLLVYIQEFCLLL